MEKIRIRDKHPGSAALQVSGVECSVYCIQVEGWETSPGPQPEAGTLSRTFSTSSWLLETAKIRYVGNSTGRRQSGLIWTEHKPFRSSSLRCFVADRMIWGFLDPDPDPQSSTVKSF
jgi:hypothetical protein